MFKKFTKTLFLTACVLLSQSAYSQTVPLDFENPYTSPMNIFGFGGTTGEVIANPDMSGDNTSANVLKMNKEDGAQTWAGVALPIATKIDFSGGNEITMKVWAPAAGTVFQIKIEDTNSPPDGNGNPSVFAEVTAATVGANAWETLTFDMSTHPDFAATISYDQIVVFADFGNMGTAGGTDYYVDDIMNPTSGPLAPYLPVSFESPSITYDAFGFGNLVAEVIANPDASGDNTTATVLHLNKPTNAETWAGVAMPLAQGIDFSGTSIISMKVWSPAAGVPFRFKIEDLSSIPMGGGNPTVFAEIIMNTTVANTWETLTFDMAGDATFDATVNYNQIVIFPNVDLAGTGASYYIDDIQTAMPVMPTGPVLPLEFEDATLAYEPMGFGGVDSVEIIANPDASGENTSATVWHLFKSAGAETWGGSFITLSSPINFSGSSVLSMKVWAPNAGTAFNLKVEDSNDGSIVAEVIRTTTVGGAWETLTFDMAEWADFNASNNYDRVVVFPNFDVAGTGTSYYVDDIQGSAPAVTLPSIPIDFESSTLTYTLFPFGNNTAQRIANPDASGDNTSANVLEIFKPENAETWAGVAMPLQNIVDLSAGGVFSMKVWSPDAGVPFMLKMEDTTSPPDANGNPSIISEVFASTTVANAWETLVFDMTTFAGYDASHQYNQIVIFANMNNPGNPGGTTYYVDDIQANSVVNPITLPTLPVDFEQGGAGITYQTFGFGNLEAMMIANPDASGMNTSANVLQLTKTMGAETWAGVAIPLETAIDLGTATGSNFSVDVWSPRAGVPFLLKFEDLDDPGTIFVELAQSTTTSNAWETLVFDMSTGTGWDANAAYDQVVVFPDFGTAGMAENFYIDNINNAGPTSISKVDLEKVKVNAFPNPVDEVLNLQISIPVSGQLTVDVIDVLGRNVNQLNLGNLTAGNYTDELNVSTLNTGTYFMITRLDGTIISTNNIFVK